MFEKRRHVATLLKKHGMTSLKKRDTVPQTEGYTPPPPPPMTEGDTPQPPPQPPPQPQTP